MSLRGPQNPPPEALICGPSLSGTHSATATSVVISNPAMEAASCKAVRTTLVGSMTPDWKRFSYCSLCALNPRFSSLSSNKRPATTPPS